MHSLSLLSLLLPLTSAIPFRTSNNNPRSNTPTHLLGTSFGLPHPQTFDYVIVGGGTAGLLLAARLSEDSTTTVAVIEAGGFYELENGNVSQIPLDASVGSDKGFANVNRAVDWGFSTVPQAGALNATPHYARGRCLGGSSARNYMAYQRGTIDSYNLWATQVDDPSYTWPSLLPYLQKSVAYTTPDASKRARNASVSVDLKMLETGKKGKGKGGVRSGGEVGVTFSNYAQAISSWVQRGLAEIGIKPRDGFTSGALFGSSYVLENIEAATQTRESSETAFLTADVLARGNLVVFTHTMAQKVVFDGTRAKGVEVVTDGMGYLLSAGMEVILSAGSFQSPQLLMVSGVGPRSTLERYGIEVVADRPGVGQNMWDHVFFGPSYEVNVVTGSSTNNPTFLSAATQSYLQTQSGILTNSGGDLFAWEKLPRTTNAHPTFTNTTLTSLSAFPPDWPEVEYLTVAGYLGDNVDYSSGPTSGNYASVVAALVAPLSRGTVSISSANATDPPLINPNWLTHPTDQAVAIAAYKRVRQLWSTEAMKGVKVGEEVYPGLAAVKTESDEEILGEVRKAFNTVWHAGCTNKMGRKDDPMAVVDTRARVYGVEGLRVVDASAFALLPPGHPVSTIYALAEKIADDIKNDKNA
ncbi:GMC oxidoreductase [Saccharata proteae CBS 121410]|uniref:GMC oxidoreductase n=1 Tax=Saccharata proteae CBS 121410 TaxID=1314787 RepID=A0A9P4HX09_9PEZI|nr:GMC oxidoreductase [Saccharata proteae CBS 121410]